MNKGQTIALIVGFILLLLAALLIMIGTYVKNNKSLNAGWWVILIGVCLLFISLFSLGIAIVWSSLFSSNKVNTVEAKSK